MASKKVTKSRLGRGLGNLIAGGMSGATTKGNTKKKAQAAKRPPVAKKPVKQAPINKPKQAKKKPSRTPKVEEAIIEKAISTPEMIEKTVIVEQEEPREIFLELSLSLIERNPYQPRKAFSDETIHDLAESIRSEGLLQPIIVRKQGDKYSLIAGERRMRAFEYLRLPRIPARIIEAGDASTAVMALIENLQREDLNPIDESFGYASLMNDFNLTQEAVAERVGKGRASVANALRLLNLDKEIQGYLGKGILSVGHAKVILSLAESEHRVLLARKIIEQGMSVREAERTVKTYKSTSPSRNDFKTNRQVQHETAVRDLEQQLAKFLSTKVEVKAKGSKGKLVIQYKSHEELERILSNIGMTVS